MYIINRGIAIIKAIRVLENRSHLVTTPQVGKTSPAWHEPSDILIRLTAFVAKASRLQRSQQKKLVRRLRRLARDLSRTHFSQKFRLSVE